MHSDPIADFICRVNNGLLIRRRSLTLPHSKLKERMAELLSQEGFLGSTRVLKRGSRSEIEVELRYTDGGESVIKSLRRVSKPSLRRYASVDQLIPWRSGLGLRIVSTSKGLMTDVQARQEKVGGEILCEVW